MYFKWNWWRCDGRRTLPLKLTLLCLLRIHRKTNCNETKNWQQLFYICSCCFLHIFHSGPPFCCFFVFKQWCQPVTALSCVALLFVLRDSDSIKLCEQGDYAVIKTQRRRSWQVQKSENYCHVFIPSVWLLYCHLSSFLVLLFDFMIHYL